MSAPRSEGSPQVKLGEITVAARARLAPLTPEVAGYIVWLVTAEVLSAPRVVSAERIGVTAVGEVMLAAGEPEVSEASERELRRLLGELLSLCPSSTPALKRACERAASGDLEALQRELAAALIPINHAASRRALARLYRETERARVELVAPLTIVEDEDGPRATATVTLPSPAPVAPLREADWETPASAVLHHCDTMPGAVRDDMLMEDRAWVAGAARDDALAAPPSEGRAGEVQGESAAPATVGTTLRSAVDAELLEIDVQFARDTERPAWGEPREWHGESPALPGAEATLSEAVLDALERGAPETVPDELHRRTQRGLSPVALLGEVEVSRAVVTPAEPQTLRASVPAESGVADRHRSDLGQLLSRFLSESGSDERITKDLRRTMGLELEAERLSDDEPSRVVGG